MCKADSPPPLLFNYKILIKKCIVSSHMYCLLLQPNYYPCTFVSFPVTYKISRSKAVISKMVLFCIIHCLGVTLCDVQNCSLKVEEGILHSWCTLKCLWGEAMHTIKCVLKFAWHFMYNFLHKSNCLLIEKGVMHFMSKQISSNLCFILIVCNHCSLALSEVCLSCKTPYFEAALLLNGVCYLIE